MKQSVDLHEYRGRPWRVHERLVHLLVHRPHAREDLHKNNNHPWLVITKCILTCADNVMDDVTAIEKQNLPRLDLDPTFNFSGHMITVFVSCITCSSQEIKWRIEINKYFEFSKSLKRKIRDFFWGVRKVKQLEWQSGEHWAGGRERQLAFIDSGELRHPSSSSRAGHQRPQVSPSLTLALVLLKSSIVVLRKDVLTKIFECRQPRYRFLSNLRDDWKLYNQLGPYLSHFDKPEEKKRVFIFF